MYYNVRISYILATCCWNCVYAADLRSRLTKVSLPWYAWMGAKCCYIDLRCHLLQPRCNFPETIMSIVGGYSHKVMSTSKISLKSRRTRKSQTPLHGHRLRTPPTDKLTTILQQICRIAMTAPNISTCQDVGMWQILSVGGVRSWCS